MHDSDLSNDDVSQSEPAKPAELVARPAIMTAQISIIRAGTGKVENYTITGTVPAESTEAK